MDRLAPSRSLAQVQQLVLADCTMDAGARAIAGPAGSATLEPQVMRVLLALAARPGAVVSREQLLEDCWDGVVVGEDSLNRAISAIRRALREAGVAGVQVETLSKTGYRLLLDQAPAPDPAALFPRRALLAGAAVTGLASVAGWRWLGQPDPAIARADALVREAHDHWRLGGNGDSRDAVRVAELAVAVAPDHAPAWGMLALMQRDLSENGAPEQAQPALDRCLQAINRALALDPGQGEALAARALIPPMFGDWLGVRRGLETVLHAVPDQSAALDALGVLHGSTGLMSRAMDISLRQTTADPLAALFQYKLIYRQWANGLIRDMDRTADRAVALWPMHMAVWMARMWTYAYTERADAALRMLEDQAHSQSMPPPLRNSFAATFTALATRQPAAINEAIARNRKLAPRGIGPAVIAIQHLSILGDVDGALDVARGHFLGEGKSGGRVINDPRFAANLNEQHRRKSLVLFIPATASLRAHPGFMPMIERMGMADYWAKTGVTPDFMA